MCGSRPCVRCRRFARGRRRAAGSLGRMERWTRFVLRHRWPVLGVWAVVLVAGFVANARLAPLLSNEFLVPGTDSERVRTLLTQHFGDRSDGNFLIVARVANSADLVERGRVEAAMRRAAA